MAAPIEKAEDNPISMREDTGWPAFSRHRQTLSQSVNTDSQGKKEQCKKMQKLRPL
jgi:hypothetical protein